MTATSIPAVVPAAGKSRRMGQSKMLLPFGGQPLIGRVIQALRQGGASPVLVVTPPVDAADGPGIAAAASRAGALVITPQKRPAEMRESAELAIDRLARDGPPAGLVLTPGDSPGITPTIVGQLLARWSENPGAIIVPRAGVRRAHPIVLPWDLAREIPQLPRHEGINSLMTTHPDRVVELELERYGTGRRAEHPGGSGALETPREAALDRPPLRRGQGKGRPCRDRPGDPLAGDRRGSSPGPGVAVPGTGLAGAWGFGCGRIGVCQRYHAHSPRRRGRTDPAGERRRRGMRSFS